MTRVICMDNPEADIKASRLYMYAPNCWCANPFVAIQFHVEGAAREFGDMCHCHEGDYIWDIEPVCCYSLEVYETSTNANAQNREQEVRIFLSTAEALGLSFAIEHSFAAIAFGVPVI